MIASRLIISGLFLCPILNASPLPRYLQHGHHDSRSSLTLAKHRIRSDFTLANGQAAQALNAEFQTLTTSSPCNGTENACINNDLAQCINGAFVTTPCGTGLVCVALPLVNSAGTSITCDTTDDAVARIAATGATGGLTGGASGGQAGSFGASNNNSQVGTTNDNVCGNSNSSNSNGSNNSDVTVTITVTATPTSTIDSTGANFVNSSNNSTPAATSTSSAKSFQVQNGLDAQKLNAQFATLSSNSSCTTGDIGCIGGNFAQCVDGSFVLEQCAAGTTCMALPLVNKPGTALDCDTQADGLARFKAAGVSGGLTGTG